MELEPAAQNGPPAGREGDVETVFLGVVYRNGATRQFTAHRPLDWVMAVGATDVAASLVPGLSTASRKEPRITVTFAGNPDAGGIEVHSEGTAPG